MRELAVELIDSAQRLDEMDQAAEPDGGSVSLVVQGAVDKFRASLTRPQREKFKSCDLSAVNNAVKEVENTLGGLRKNPRMHRARRFIEGMSHLSKVVEVFLNVSDVIAFIWVCLAQNRLLCLSAVSLF